MPSNLAYVKVLVAIIHLHVVLTSFKVFQGTSENDSFFQATRDTF